MPRKKRSSSLCVQYGCGLTAPPGWLNFDASPTLRLQKVPIIGRSVAKMIGTVFPDAVRYGDIVRGLPLADGSCVAVFASHVLEHLSLEDFRAAIRNTYGILQPGGVFRLVVPDLEAAAKRYVESEDSGAAEEFLRTTDLGVTKRARGLAGLLRSVMGNSRHLWMWDYRALEAELAKAGFMHIRRCIFGDAKDNRFQQVELESRFRNAVAVECVKQDR